jgi:hypothetical protein
MGFRFKSKVYRLVFEGELAGLEVMCRSGTVQQFVAISQLEGAAGEESTTATLNNMNNFNKLCAAFSVSLSSWNLEDEVTGLPVPTTLEGLFSQDIDLVLDIIDAWMTGIAGTKSKDSSEAQESEESTVDIPDYLPMEVLG